MEKSGVLQSWKEIAIYVGRGVRTVQRWESFGLPVRRPSGRTRSAVLALKDEVDGWLRHCARHDVATMTMIERENGVFLERRNGGDRRVSTEALHLNGNELREIAEHARSRHAEGHGAA